MTAAQKEWWLGSFMLLLLAGLFVVDILTPQGFANHFLYAAVVLVATASRFELMPMLAAGLATLLTVVGMFLSPALPGMPIWFPIGNRSFTISILWILVWFAWKRRQAETTLKRVNEGLEETVTLRTSELAAVNKALVSEITERMQTEQAFRLSEGRLAGILEMAEDAIIVIEHDRSIVLFNHGAVKLFGYNPEEVLGQPINQLLPDRFGPDDGRPVEAIVLTPHPGRRVPQRQEVFGLKKDGTEFPAEASISKLAIGEKTTFTVIVRDISDRLRSERQLQSLTSRLMTAQEEERRRIARELHDDINQRLALLAIDMGNLESAPAALTEQARETVQSMAQRLAAISDDVRRVAYRFHSTILEDLGLTAALTHMADEWSASTGIKTVIVQEEIDALPRAVASCLYRIAQECLANVMKHAKATRVELELTYDGQEITLTIHDSGVGFDLEKAQTNQLGLGLVNMRERVRSVHGRLDIQSKPGRGTRVTVQVPFPGARYEETTNPVGR